MVHANDTSKLGNSDWEPIPPPPGSTTVPGGLPPQQDQPLDQNSAPEYAGIQPNQPDEGCDPAHHVKGLLILLAFLIFHFLCFLVTLSMGLGVGILCGALHEICWDSVMVPFWQVYIALVTIAILIELSFRVGRGTKLNTWLDDLQKKHYIELFYIPRVLYFWGYTGAVTLLYFSYHGAHYVPGAGKLHNGTTKAPPRIKSPMWMGQTDDHFHYSAIFFVALCYMIYVTAKENDWMTYRKAIIADGDADPVSRGSIGSFALYVLVHISIMFLYVLPLIGCVYLFRQFELGARVTFFLESIMAVVVGVGAVFIERRAPFPTEPLQPPSYAYENHLRIRVILLQLWLIPLAAGNYFGSSRADPLDAQNDDFLIFTVEVGVGIVQAVKIFGNDIFVHLIIRRTHELTEAVQSEGTQYDYFPGQSLTSVASTTRETQTGSDTGILTAELQHVTRKPDIRPVPKGSSEGPPRLEKSRPKSDTKNPFDSEEHIPFVMAEMGLASPQSETSVTLIMKRDRSLMLNNNNSFCQRSNSESQYFK